MRRVWLMMILALLLGARPVVAQPAPPAPMHISLGYVLAGDFITAFVAKDRGYFADHGLDVELVKIMLATNIPAALVSGSLDVGMSTATIILQATSGGLDFQAVAGVSRFYPNNPKISVVGRAGTAMKTAADLRGMKVGIPGLNSVADVGLRYWLLRNHVNLADVTFVEANFPQMKDMLANRSVDAVAVLEPFRSRIMADGTGYKIADYYTELGVEALSAIWMSTTAWATAHPHEIAALRAGLADAAAFIAAHPDETKPTEAKYLGYVSPVPPSISLTVKPEDFAFYQKAMMELGLIDKPVDVTRLVYP
jgi:NitT/TauT family transport system substrate-binding protein